MISNLKSNSFIKKNYLFLLIFFFIFSRFIIYNFLEIKINDPNYGYHLLDISLLQQDLFNSLMYLHSQPLLWNLFNGIIVKLFDADISSISIFFNIYHYCLSILIIFIFIKISREFYVSKKIELFIFFFITLNPSIIFYENIFSYSHTTLFFFTLIVYNIIRFFKTNDLKYETYIYLNILTLSLIWVLFQPILLLIVFITIRFFKKSSKKNFIIFLLIFIVSLSPMIKNKLIFGVLTASSKSGQDFGTVFYDWRQYCGDPNKDLVFFTKEYFKEFQKSFKHPSLIGEKSHYNNLGIIILGRDCFKSTLNRIFENPYIYLDGRVRAFLASHGKFSFDYVYPNPIGWNKYYQNISKLYDNKKIKLIRQILVFALKMYIYFTILFFIFFYKNNNELTNGLKISSIPYIYLLSIGTLAAGTEQERILYTGFVVNILFFIILLKKSKIRFYKL
tara:strand:+ start:383 stop:1726 length:1344 start_codon:yes stop_codon:yes gene_type:complete